MIGNVCLPMISIAASTENGFPSTGVVRKNTLRSISVADMPDFRGLSSSLTIPAVPVVPGDVVLPDISILMLSLLTVSDARSVRCNGDLTFLFASGLLVQRLRKLQLLPILTLSVYVDSYAYGAMKLTLSSNRTRSEVQSSPTVTQLHVSLPFTCKVDQFTM